MTRALVIESSGNLWGSERALLDLLNSMPELEVAVCCPSDRPLNGELAKLQVRTLPYLQYGLHEKSRWARLWAALGVLRACLEFRPNVIYLNQCGCYRVALPAATLLNLPIVGHVRIFEDAAYLARQRPARRRLRGIIAISSAIETEVRRFPQLESIQLHRIYDAYVPVLPMFNNLHQGKRDSHRVACVGRLVPIKGQDILVRGLSELEGLNRGVECLFIGDGDPIFTRELRRIALSGTVAHDIHWVGLVNDVFSLLLTCSVLICPSHREPLGRVIFEAWDAGLVPLVFSGSGGAAEIVLSADGGIVYEAQTPGSLAQALRNTLALGQEEKTRLINNGRSWMAKHCNPENYGKAVSAILTSARQ